MIQARFIQAAIWLTATAATYIALLVYEHATKLTGETRFFAHLAAMLAIGVFDLGYLLVGRAVMTRRRRHAVGRRKRHLVASGYVPIWFITMVGAAVVSCVYLLTTHPWFDSPSVSTSIALGVLSPLLMRSQHWGLARFTRRGVSVVWDDGFVSKLRWTDISDLAALQGKISAEHDWPSFPRRRDFKLVGRDSRASIEAAQDLWSAGRATNGTSKEEGRP
jgi:hypothetical protein